MPLIWGTEGTGLRPPPIPTTPSVGLGGRGGGGWRGSFGGAATRCPRRAALRTHGGVFARGGGSAHPTTPPAPTHPRTPHAQLQPPTRGDTARCHPSPRRDAPLWCLPQFPLVGMGYSEGGDGVAQALTGGCRAPRAHCTAHPALRGGCSPSMHPEIPSREVVQGRAAPHSVSPRQDGQNIGSKMCCQLPLGAAPHFWGEAPRYLFRGCLQCRFTRKLLPSPSLPGWRGPEPWARGNHSAGGLAPFSSARGWQATELPSAQERPPHISPVAPSPGTTTCPGRRGCPQGWARRVPPVDVSPSKPQPTGTPTLCPSPHQGMPGVAFWGRTTLSSPPCP